MQGNLPALRPQRNGPLRNVVNVLRRTLRTVLKIRPSLSVTRDSGAPMLEEVRLQSGFSQRASLIGNQPRAQYVSNRFGLNAHVW
jgi:hypothetical protein